MKEFNERIALSLIIITMLTIACTVVFMDHTQSSVLNPNGIIISVKTDKPTYHGGEDINITVSAFNPTDSPITLMYTANPPFKLNVIDESGESVYYFPTGPHVMWVTNTLIRQNQTLIYYHELKENLPPGDYLIEAFGFTEDWNYSRYAGTWISINSSMSGTAQHNAGNDSLTFAITSIWGTAAGIIVLSIIASKRMNKRFNNKP